MEREGVEKAGGWGIEEGSSGDGDPGRGSGKSWETRVQEEEAGNVKIRTL